MKQYKLSKKALAQARKKVILQRLIIFPFLMGFLFLMGYLNPVSEESADLQPILMTVVVVLLFVAAVLGTLFSLFVTVPNSIKSLSITLSNDGIYRQHTALSKIWIPWQEVKAIYFDRKGNVVVEGKVPSEKIGISPLMEDFEEMKAVLEKAMPIQSAEMAKPMELKRRLFTPLTVIGLVCIVATWVSSNPWVAIPCSIVALGLIVGYLVLVAREKQLQPQVKARLMLLAILILPILAKLFIILFPGFTGFQPRTKTSRHPTEETREAEPTSTLDRKDSTVEA
jgi:ABC-type multidrug transport system fused ATPase/permease subunit